MTTLVTYDLTAGWHTFGLALPEGTARAVGVGTLPTQCDVKTRWPDGSIRFAIVTVQITTDGAYPITAVAPARRAAAPVASAWPTVSVAFTIAGSRWVADLPDAHTQSAWLSGSLVQEARSIVAPVLVSGTGRGLPPPLPPTWPRLPGEHLGDLGYFEDQRPRRRHIERPSRLKPAWPWQAPIPSSTPLAAGTAHALLQVVFDIRSFADGGHRVDVSVQNARDIPAAQQVPYDVRITINGADVFVRTGVVHSWGARWRQVFPVNHLAGTVVADMATAVAAGALPEFLASVSDGSYTIDAQRHDILQYGDISCSMTAPGGRAEIGCYPQWTVQGIVHGRPSTRAYVLRSGDLSGSWSGYIKGPDGVSLIRIDQGHTNYWLDARSPAPNGPANGYAGATWHIDATHIPSLCYVPYLWTGDRYYYDGQKAWAATVMLQTYTGDAHGFGTQTSLRSDRSLGMGLLTPYCNEPRGFGWGLREVVDAAWACADDDPDKPYFSASVTNNLDWLNRYAPRMGGFPAGVPFWEFDPGNLHIGYFAFCMWQSSYLTWAVDHAAQQGFSPTAPFRNRVVNSMIVFMRDLTPVEYPLSIYYNRVGTFANNTQIPFTLMSQFFSTNYTGPRDSLDGPRPPDPSPPGPIIGYYGSDYRMLLVMGVRDGLPGAQAALDALHGYRSAAGQSILDDISWRSQYALAIPGALPIPPDPEPEPEPDTNAVVALIVTADQTDPDHSNNEAVLPITPAPDPPTPTESDLQIEMTSVPPSPVAGAQATLHVTVTNLGPADNTGISVSLQTRSGAITVVSGDLSQGAISGGAWQVGDLAAGAVATATVLAQF